METTIKVTGTSTVGGVKYDSKFTFIMDELAMRKLAANDAKVQTRSGGDKYITSAGQNGNVIVKFTGVQAGDGDDNITVEKTYIDMAAIRLLEQQAARNEIIAQMANPELSAEDIMELRNKLVAIK